MASLSHCPSLKAKVKRKGQKRSVTFSAEMLTVDTCRLVSISTAGVILAFDQAALFFWQKKRTSEKELLIAG